MSPYRILRSLGLALVLVVLASACAATPTVTTTVVLSDAEIAAAAEADRTFAATPEYLARVKVNAKTAESLRFEVFTSIDSSLFRLGSRTEPVMSGEQSGMTSRIFMDLGSLMGPVAATPQIDRSALTMTLVTEGDVVYVNAPFFAEVLQAAELTETKQFAWIFELVNGWGRVDAGRLGHSDIMRQMGMNGGANATEMLALLESVSTVLDGGSGDVRGVPVRIAHAQVSIADVLEQSGQDLSDMGLGSNERDMLRDLSANMAVHIDDDGQVRRLEYTLDFGAMAGLDPQVGDLDMAMWQRVDFFDYGSDIEIAVPVVWTDITDDFGDLLDQLS